MNLEFAKNREQLIFEKEYNLNAKPLEIDLLVVKKDASVQIANEIGRFFKGHNVMEYKSPEGLFQYFNEHGYKVSNPHKGIYYIESKVLFPTQVIVTKELDKEEHIWLGAMSAKLQKQDMQELVKNIRKLTEKEDKEQADFEIKSAIIREYGLTEEEAEKYL